MILLSRIIIFIKYLRITKLFSQNQNLHKNGSPWHLQVNMNQKKWKTIFQT